MAFEYEVDPSCDHIIDEKGNTIIAMRSIKWGAKGDFKLDIRKYYQNSDGSETMAKGVSFLTEEGPHTLTKTLIEAGFGRTDDIVQAVSDRPDFRHSLNKVLNGEDDEFYDPTAVGDELYIPDDDTFFDYEEEK